MENFQIIFNIVFMVVLLFVGLNISLSFKIKKAKGKEKVLSLKQLVLELFYFS
jgi:hypothetical protein